MSKIVKNNTGSAITITDVGGVVIPASPGSYTIPPQDYLIWANSSDILTYVNDTSPTPSVTINDGSFDLTPTKGVDLIKGFFRINADTTTIGDGDTIGSYTAATDNGYITSETVGSRTGLDVNIIGGSTTGTNRFELPASTVGTPGVEQTLISHTVAVGKTRTLSKLLVTSRGPGKTRLLVGGTEIASGRVSAGNLNFDHQLSPWRNVAAGVLIEVKYLQLTGTPASDVEAYLTGNEF